MAERRSTGEGRGTAERGSLTALLTRSAVGGVLMGLANLVPGISGGTMLLAAGVYTRFIEAVAEVTTFKFRFRSLVILVSIGVSAGLPQDRMPELVVMDRSTPSVYNDPGLASRLAAVWTRQLGEDRVLEVEKMMVGEDFARYGRTEPRIPSLLFWLGAVEPSDLWKVRERNGLLPSLHSPLFSPAPEPTIRTGVKAMTAAVLELLK